MSKDKAMAEPKESNLQVFYKKDIAPRMMKKFGYKNALQVPRLKKIVINMGVGKGAEDIKIVEAAQGELTQIAGQYVGLMMLAALMGLAFYNDFLRLAS